MEGKSETAYGYLAKRPLFMCCESHADRILTKASVTSHDCAQRRPAESVHGRRGESRLWAQLTCGPCEGGCQLHPWLPPMRGQWCHHAQVVETELVSRLRHPPGEGQVLALAKTISIDSVWRTELLPRRELLAALGLAVSPET